MSAEPTHLFMVARHPTDWMLVRARDAHEAAELANAHERLEPGYDPEIFPPFRPGDAAQLPSPDGEPGVVE